MCLIEKLAKKMIEFSGSLKLNEIHIIDSPFNEDPKNINFSRDVLILGERWLENLEKMGNKMDIYCYSNWGVVNFERCPYSLVPKSL